MKLKISPFLFMIHLYLFTSWFNKSARVIYSLCHICLTFQKNMFTLQHFLNNFLLKTYFIYEFLKLFYNITVEIMFKLSCFHYNLFKILNPNL